MNLKDLNLKAYDIKNKFVVINDAEITEAQMSTISQILKKHGAIEVVYAVGGITIQALSDADLKNIGLTKISPVLESQDEQTSTKSPKRGSSTKKKLRPSPAS